MMLLSPKLLEGIVMKKIFTLLLAAFMLHASGFERLW